MSTFFQYSVVWTDNVKTNCVCLFDPQDYAKLFELERASPGICLPNCGQQMCGTLKHTVQSVALFVNEYYSAANRDCDDVFMRTKWPLSKGPFLFKLPDNSEFLVSIFPSKINPEPKKHHEVLWCTM